MTKALYLLGAGGHGRVVLDALLAQKVSVTGLLDPALPKDLLIFHVPVLGTEALLHECSPASTRLVNGVGANPQTATRRKIFEHWKQKDFHFFTLQHPSAIVGLECSLGEGAQVMAGVVLQNRVHVGANTVLNTRASVDHDCHLAAHAFVSPGAVLCGNVHVGEGVFIGAGAVILPGVRIGAGAVVAAGALVKNDVPENSIVVGNPAKPM